MKDDLKNSTDFRSKLSKNHLGLRILIALIAIFFLGIFLHFREARVEVLEIGSKANKFMVSQVDFEFPDEESTILLRQEALKEIGTIYKLNETTIRDVRFSFENYLIKNHGKNQSSNSFENFYKTADAFEEVMFRVRFTDPKTLQKLKEADINTTYYLIFIPQKENKKLSIPDEIWGNMAEIAESKEGLKPDILDSVLQFFSDKKWSFEEDIQAQSELRSAVQKKIPPKYTRIKAGTKIVDQGEKVTVRHVAMLQAMKDAMNHSRSLWAPVPFISSFLFAFIFVGLSALYFRMNHPEILQSLDKLALLVTIVFLTLIFAKITEYVLVSNTSRMMEAIRYPLIIPFATILFCILLNVRLALYASTFLAIILSITLAVDHSRFLIINLITSLIIISCTKRLRKRTEVFSVCAKTYFSAIPVLFAFNFASNTLWSTSLGWDLLSALIFMLITAILVVGLLPILESVFSVMTEMTIMEYMDPNNELLRRLTLEIPGTYQHCLVLGNLAEAMAQSIDADGLFCRVATLYHDIGKLNNPQFFTENQQGGVNIHQLLTPLESAQVIISHVKDGEMLARKYRLPTPFIDIIKEHHGTTLVYYFYCKELELKGNHEKEVDKKKFQYPGPKPHSRESAIIMIADTVEAASRSLSEITEETLQELVDRLVKERVDEGQLDECLLTFKELGTIKNTLIKTLLHTYHARIKYPEKSRKPAN